MEEALLTLEGAGMFVQFQHARRAAKPGNKRWVYRCNGQILGPKRRAWLCSCGLIASIQSGFPASYRTPHHPRR